MRWRRKGSVTTKDIHVIDWRQFPNFNGWQAKADEALVKKTKTEIVDSMLVLFESIQIRWQPDWLYMEACSLFDPRVLGRENANTMMTPYLQRLKTRYPNLIEDHHLLVVSTTLALDAAVPPWDGISCVVAWYDNLRKQDEAYIPFVLFALNHLVTIPASVICESTFSWIKGLLGNHRTTMGFDASSAITILSADKNGKTSRAAFKDNVGELGSKSKLTEGERVIINQIEGARQAEEQKQEESQQQQRQLPDMINQLQHALPNDHVLSSSINLYCEQQQQLPPS
jgi:hypothetical protein